VQPVSGHAVYGNAKARLPRISSFEYPGQALDVVPYTTGGIRGVEVGSVMFGRQPDGSEELSEVELVRLAIPAPRLHQSHVDYIIECF
jgi:Tryptophanase